ncbi:helix-turn-helix transcriptional regulator [Candidatus Manganitrophus noduliformans]|nr:helix-turn-helix transcriptional regulator [Candidatus Manganitrophus noduliformans]
MLLKIIEALAAGRIGVVAFGPDGAPSFMNREAKRILNGRAPEEIPVPRRGRKSILFRSERGTWRVRALRRGKKEKSLLLEPLPEKGDLRSIRSRLIRAGLSLRQQQIALLAVQGASNRQMAERFCICAQTVRDHLREIFKKLRVHRRCELCIKLTGPNFRRD